MSSLFAVDCHVHTRWSACADPIDVQDYLGCARRLDIERFAITDHSNDIYFDGEDAQGLKWRLEPSEFCEVIRKRSSRMDEYISHVGRYRDMGVRVGIELEQMPLSGDFIFDWGYREKFDVVIGSVHSVPAIRSGVAEDADAAREEFLSLTLKALDQDIDILAHPTRSLQKAGIAVPGSYYDIIIDRAISRGIPLEINSHSRNPEPEFLNRCIEKGARLILGTDSHSLSEFGDFSFHRKLLEEAGLNGDTINRHFSTALKD
ncbi:MAG: PHP domain-containing protein [Candidatus Brocadiales bacterium]